MLSSLRPARFAAGLDRGRRAAGLISYGTIKQ